MVEPVTRIGSPTSDADRFRMRGRDMLGEIVGEKSFAEAFYLIVTGRAPSPGQARILDACMIVLMDHGLTPMALVSRLVEDAVPTDIQVPVAAGLLMVGNRFAGTMAGCGRILQECRAAGGDSRSWLAAEVAKYRAANRHIPGFGHPYYKSADPRSARLFEVAATNGAAGDHVALVKLLGEEADKAAGRHLTLNVTGALGAVLCEIDFPVEAMRACTVVGRAAGLAAHALEEKTSPITPSVVDFVNGIDYRED